MHCLSVVPFPSSVSAHFLPMTHLLLWLHYCSQNVLCMNVHVYVQYVQYEQYGQYVCYSWHDVV